ncbi:hypothetical protein ACLB2K_016097 [Fragaria x ananassa]
MEEELLIGAAGVDLSRRSHFNIVADIKQCLKGEGKVEVQKELEVVKRPKKPPAVARKPDVDTGATLAHEMMNAWLHLKC